MPVKRTKGITGKLDRLVGKHVRSRGVCHGIAFSKWLVKTMPGREPIKCKGNLEWAHFKSRTYLSTRWDVKNGFALCNAHHRYMDKNKDEWTLYLLEEHPELISHILDVFRPKTKRLSDKKRKLMYAELEREIEGT